MKNCELHYKIVDNKNNLSFKSGHCNILAFSDLHGGLRAPAKMFNSIAANVKNIFPQQKNSNVLNLLAMPGDIFINQQKRGYITKPNITNGDVQLLLINNLLKSIRNLIHPKAKYDALFTPGNHDFDGGDVALLNMLKKMPVKMLLTNAHNTAELSPLYDNKLFTSVIYEIPDDRKPNLKHKVLTLGVTLQNMDYFNEGLIKKIKFLDNFTSVDEKLKDDAYLKTIEKINSIITSFKNENPNGAVVILSHLGNRFSGLLAENNPDINLILNGHDHVQKLTRVNRSKIASLGQNSEIYRGIQLNFDDYGRLENINIDTFYPLDEKVPNAKDLMKDVNSMLKEDIKPLVKFNPNIFGINEFIYTTEVRYKNSPYANFLSSALRDYLIEKGFKVDLLGCQSSSIRGSIKEGSANLDLLKTFDGIKDYVAGLEIAPLKGREILDIVIENVLGNIEKPERSTIMQWSDLKVDRSLFTDIRYGKTDKTFKDGVKIRNRITGEYEPLMLDKEYYTAFANKDVNRRKECFEKIKHKFKPTGINVPDAFHEYMDEHKYIINITPEIMEERII